MTPMTKKARIAAAISAPVVGVLAAVGIAGASAAPAGAATVIGPIVIGSNYIQILLLPLLKVTLGHI
jgi:hypothetical protein